MSSTLFFAEKNPQSYFTVQLMNHPFNINSNIASELGVDGVTEMLSHVRSKLVSIRASSQAYFKVDCDCAEEKKGHQRVRP